MTINLLHLVTLLELSVWKLHIDFEWSTFYFPWEVWVFVASFYLPKTQCVFLSHVLNKIELPKCDTHSLSTLFPEWFQMKKHYQKPNLNQEIRKVREFARHKKWFESNISWHIWPNHKPGTWAPLMMQNLNLLQNDHN